MYNNLETKSNLLEDRVSELESELAKYIPSQTGPIGKSRENPAEVNTTLFIEFSIGGEGDFSGKMTVTEFIRGDEALEQIIEVDANLRDLVYEVEKYWGLMIQYNESFGSDSVYYLNARDQYERAVNNLDRYHPLKDGYEFLIIKIKFEYLQGPESLTLGPTSFKVISESGIIYNTPYVETSSPEFAVEMIPNSEFEGWCVYEVLKEDQYPELSFASHTDGTGGLWFKLFE